MDIKTKLLLTLVFALCAFSLAAQTVTIGSVTPTATVCSADGSIAVANVQVSGLGSKTVVKVEYSLEAISPTTFFLGYVESGSDKYNHTLSGIPKGSYRVRVKVSFTDGINTSTAQSSNTAGLVTIGGTYAIPTVSANTYVESLLNCDTTGIMYVRVIGGTKPTTVKITAYAGTGTSAVGQIPVEKIINATTTDYYFYSLPSGTYTFQVTDNCNSTTNVIAVLNTVDLATFDWFSSDQTKYTYFTWVDNCNLTVSKYFGTNTHPNKVQLQAYYGQHPKFSLKVENTDLTLGTYTSTNAINAVVTIPPQYSINQEFKGKLTVIDPCGRTLATKILNIRLSALSAVSPVSDANVTTVEGYAYALLSGDLTKLGLAINLRAGVLAGVDWYKGQQYRITFNGTTSVWQTITGDTKKLDTLTFATGFTTYKALFAALNSESKRAGTLEIKTKCGGISKSNFTILKPYDGNAGWTCGMATTYFAIYQGTSVLAMPAKVIYTDIVTGAQYTLNIPTWNTPSTLYKTPVPPGTYTKTVVGADGYSDLNINTVTFKGVEIKQDESVTPYLYTDRNTEMRGKFNISPVTAGMHLKLLSAPDPTYFYDKPITVSATASAPLDFGPNNGDFGIMGDYVFEVTNLCGTKDIIEVKQQNGLEVMSFTSVVGTNACAGAALAVNGAIRKWYQGVATAIPTYYEFVSYPAGFIPPAQNVAMGVNTTLRLKGTYVIGLTSSLSLGAVIRKDTVEYEGSGVEVDMNASFAYVCIGDVANQGKIHVRAKNGIGPYTYYLSNKGTGGVDISSKPYIASNTNGDFYTQSLIQGTEYDITIKDNCGNAAVQTFQVSYLSDFKLAYVENALVCVGEAIQFRSMALPDPIFTWYKPNGDFWSNSASPFIVNAQTSDAGQYRVEIQSSLCGSTTDIFLINVVVVETPTLIHTGGSMDQIICAGTNIEDIVIKWGGSATDIAITGLVAANYTKDIANKTLTIRGSLSGSYTISTVGGCTVASLSGVIISKSAPALSTIPTNQFYCTAGQAITTLTYTFSNTNVAEVTGLPPGLTSLTAANLTISGTPTTLGIYNVQIRLINSEPLHPCPIKDYLFTITIGIDLSLSATSATCASKGKITATIAGGVSPYQYSLDNVAWGTSTVLDNLLSGDYTVYVKDKNGCITSKNVTVPLETGFPVGSFSYADGPPSYGIAKHELQNCIFFGSIDPTKIQTAAQASVDANTALNDNGIVGLVNGQLPKNVDGFTDLSNPNFTLDVSGKLTLKVKVSNLDSKDANMMAWIDFNKNGVYDPNEASALLSISAGTIDAEATLVWNNAPLVNGVTYLRLRITSETISNTDAVTSFADGEVEDYRLDISLFSISKRAEVKINGGKIANMGDIVLYTIEINNHVSQNIVLNVFDIIPDHTVYVDNTANPAATMHGDTIKWELLNVDSGTSQITFEVKVATFPTDGIVRNIAYAAYLKDTINSASDLAEITVNPMLANDDCAITWVNKSVDVNVLHNDIYNEILLPIIHTQPAKGTAVVQPDSTIQYIPNLNTKGVDDWQYQIVNVGGTAVLAKVQVAVVQALNNPFVICKNSTKSIAVEPIAGVTFSWYKKTTDNIAFATGNSIEVSMKEADTLFYLSAHINGVCKTGKLSVPVYLGVAPIYADVRIEVCKYPERLVNLSQFIDTTFISGTNWVLNWTNVMGPAVNAQHQINSADIVTDGTYTYRYHSESNCGTSKANLYLTANKERTAQTDKTVVMCYKYAGDIHLLQILGLEAQGTWQWDPSLNNYITEAQNAPHQGALLFDGKAAYLDGMGLGITHNTDPNARQIEITYTTTGTSCVGAKTYKLNIILTQDML